MIGSNVFGWCDKDMSYPREFETKDHYVYVFYFNTKLAFKHLPVLPSDWLL